MAQVSEGATILLTWIINFVKWNAGHTRYKYNMDGAGPGGHKILNNQLVPVHTNVEGKEDGDE